MYVRTHSSSTEQSEETTEQINFYNNETNKH